ncbi:LysE family translocator [Paracoccus fistulariae]|uniref:LysE family translocator n=1 Tax=Paracoccus fistulariae TaxID=658446 RepID=A0ABY7SHD0_9RHOB|nr:LysE family translocator [Paracoccus fistulariae]MDB6181014.1 LysE family translocator [Paracoccus fistulariae]WCR06310.1 LysE family translocator [Paracoccus fistulariae]
MTLDANSLWLYAGAMVAIWLTPGPVWVAIMARALASGFRGVWPLAVGVAIGDVLWPLIAIFGLAVVVSQSAELLVWLRWIAAIVFVGMGIALLRQAKKPVERDARLTQRGRWAGFSAGLLAIAGNPKAALFYVTVLPGFFDVRQLTGWDVAVIAAMSGLIPFGLNLIMGGAVAAARAKLATPTGLRRMNLLSGGLLILVGCVIGLGQLLAT